MERLLTDRHEERRRPGVGVQGSITKARQVRALNYTDKSGIDARYGEPQPVERKKKKQHTSRYRQADSAEGCSRATPHASRNSGVRTIRLFYRMERYLTLGRLRIGATQNREPRMCASGREASGLLAPPTFGKGGSGFVYTCSMCRVV